MALSNSGVTANTTYLSFYEGFFTKKVEPNTEGATKRINKNQTEVWELKFDTVSGILTSITYHEKEFQGTKLRSWNVRLQDGNDAYEIQFPYSSRVTNMFLVKLPNVNLSIPIELKAYYFQKDKKSAISVYQKGAKIESYWTKEDPKGLPQMKQVMYKGELVWDDSEMMAYLRNYIEAKLTENIKKASLTFSESDLQGEEKDLPF